MRAYSRPIWLLPRAVSPALPVFLLVSVYWGLGDELDVLHVTSIAGKGGGEWVGQGWQHEERWAPACMCDVHACRCTPARPNATPLP